MAAVYQLEAEEQARAFAARAVLLAGGEATKLHEA